MPAEVHDLALRAEIALDRPPVAGQPLGVLLAEGGDLHAADLLVGQIMGHAHETDAGNADADHCVAPGLEGLCRLCFSITDGLSIRHAEA